MNNYWLFVSAVNLSVCRLYTCSPVMHPDKRPPLMHIDNWKQFIYVYNATSCKMNNKYLHKLIQMHNASRGSNYKNWQMWEVLTVCSHLRYLIWIILLLLVHWVIGQLMQTVINSSASLVITDILLPAILPGILQINCLLKFIFRNTLPL